METGQPALLYLVPCTLLPTLISALAHREFKQLLLGPRKEEPKVSALLFVVRTTRELSNIQTRGLGVMSRLSLSFTNVHMYIRTFVREWSTQLNKAVSLTF